MQENNEDVLEVYVRLKHPNPTTDPEGFINSLPDSIVENFYMLDRNPATLEPLTLDEKRNNAIVFFERMNGSTEATGALRHIFILLENHYSKNPA